MEPPGLCRSSAAPGSQVWRSDRTRAAWPCRVAQLRFRGVYLPADLVLGYHLHTGWVISEGGAGEWITRLYSSVKEDRSPVMPLTAIHTIRKNDDGTYLLQGKAYDAGYLERWPQDWICGPVDERDSVRDAVENMAGWLKKRYTGVYGRS